MAKNYLYINIGGKAKKIGKFYYDVEGLAKKVEKAYIRDENGKAVLAYIAHIHSFTSLSYSNTSISYHTITAKCDCGETMISTESHYNDHLCYGWPHFDASTHWDHYVCKCNRIMSERQPGNAHSYTNANNIRVVQSSTCTTAGYGYWKCDSCAYEKYQAFALIDHKWQDATCTTPKTCSVCGTTEGVALGHDYASSTNIVVVKEATTCVDGQQHRYCANNCGSYQTETIHAKHNMVKSEKESTFDHYVYYCTLCGAKMESWAV